jgi:DNA-binding Lrp family transcriptional regulator
VITAFVLVDVAVDAVPEAARAITGIDGVVEVYSVTGRYDLICKVRVSANEDLAEVVTAGIDKVPGIVDSETVIAFRAYADEVLDAGFSLGAEGPG